MMRPLLHLAAVVAAQALVGSDQCGTRASTDVAVSSYKRIYNSSLDACCADCTADANCKVAVLVDGQCKLKDSMHLVDSTLEIVAIFPRNQPAPTPVPTPPPPPVPAPTPTPSQGQCASKPGVDVAVSSYSRIASSSLEACCAACSTDVKCKVAVFTGGECKLKDAVHLVDSDSSWVTIFPSGTPWPAPPAPPPPVPPARLCRSGTVCKAGIAAHLNGDANTDAIAGSRISWNYNWAMSGARKDGLDYYPQVHDAGSMRSLRNLPDSDVLFGFNEPNMNPGGGGAFMDVKQVVGFWPQIAKAANDHGVSILVGPNVANIKPDQWYDDFFNQCPNCRVDAIGFHFYSCDLQDMKILVNKLRKYGRPLWLTEFACADNPHAIAGNHGGSKDWHWQCEYMKEVIPYLEGEDIIAKYAWFSFDANYVGKSNLVKDGQLTDLGNCYNTVASGFEGKADMVVV